MNIEELRAELSGGMNMSDEVGDFCQWWWFKHLDDEGRDAWAIKNGYNKNIRADFALIDDEELMFLWAVYKMPGD